MCEPHLHHLWPVCVAWGNEGGYYCTCNTGYVPSLNGRTCISSANNSSNGTGNASGACAPVSPLACTHTWRLDRVTFGRTEKMQVGGEVGPPPPLFLPPPPGGRSQPPPPSSTSVSGGDRPDRPKKRRTQKMLVLDSFASNGCQYVPAILPEGIFCVPCVSYRSAVCKRRVSFSAAPAPFFLPQLTPRALEMVPLPRHCVLLCPSFITPINMLHTALQCASLFVRHRICMGMWPDCEGCRFWSAPSAASAVIRLH